MNGRRTDQPPGARHLAALGDAIDALALDAARIDAWGQTIAGVLLSGGRLLAAGNGGSAAHAQHLVSELVGRYRRERRPLSAIALSAEPSTVTAIANDYGIDVMFTRQVLAHGRSGDVFVGFSTSGRSPNVIAAALAARQEGLWTLALTGAAPNPLTEVSDESLVVRCSTTAIVQEVHQVALHLICEAVDETIFRTVAEVGSAG
jgi:D-sedoheptulose 7-phosphate isomerase